MSNHEILQYIKYGVILLLTVFAASRLSKILRRLLDKTMEKHGAEVLHVDATRISFFKNTISVMVWLFALIIVFNTIPELRSVGLTLFAGAGVLAAVIGFASQQAVANIVSGVFILVFRPFRIGDYIKIGNDPSGIVEDITLRHTIIKTGENRRLIIPNATINNQNILNSSIIDKKTCLHFEVAISYDSNIDIAIQLVQDECLKHPLCIDNRSAEEKQRQEPVIKVNVVALADSSVLLGVNVWCEDPARGSDLKSDLLKNIKERFDKEKIVIPYPHRKVIYEGTLPAQRS